MQHVERRVVVTGVGVVCPLGIGKEAAWAAALAGKSGVGQITRFDAKALPCTIAGEVPAFDPLRFMDKKEERRNDLFIQFGLAAAQLALEDAKLPSDKPLGERAGVIVGSGMGGLSTLEDTHLTAVNRGHRKVNPFFIPSIIVNLAAGQISIRYGASGVNFAPVSACATGNHSIGEAARHIQHGDVDLMIAGGAEATITLLGISGFTAARALSERNSEPQKASRPFDKERDGFVAGEGAGILILEELEHARARGARIYAEVVGYSATADAFHITQPSGTGAESAMRLCLRDADLKAEDVGYINAHGTSTPVGDIAETKAIKAVFGEHARKVAISSTKSMTGHLLGAAGGVEAAFTVLSLHEGVLHPTINLTNPDPECDLDYVPNEARRVPGLSVALSNSFGFGGTNAVLAFKKLEA